ncbi:hypothetical protein GGH94_002877 [Coemansia aciculifera]|uniref:GATA-type domain-containing protein n=1 Tax=Coemansia aciculifera TaxID=417176 RepID=A0A9W8M6A4_9FUNG|nr:hypothetical protein GGH94_002877 [Coemansia aciculifera]KAJ2873035.1 hypothetical protein GGH93_003547 [Coemansia aciculifera]
MSQSTNPPTPLSSSTITVLGTEGPSTPASSPIHAADHSMALSASGFSDPSYQRYQHSAAAANLSIASSLDNMGLPNSDPTTGDISAFHYLVSSSSPSGVFPASTLFPPSSDPVRMLRRSTELPLRRGSLSLSRSHPYIPTPEQHNTQRRNVCPPQKPRTIIIPAINQDGTLKKCTNCMTAETPSWRRHPDTQALLCNACGLYLRLHRKPRPITIDESGNVQVIRKNAAVQREPMNLPPSSMYNFANPNLGSTSSLSSVGSISLGSSNSSSANFDQVHHDQPHSTPLLFGSFNFPGCQLALRTNTSLANLQGIAEPFSPLELYSPVPHAQHQGAYMSIDEGAPALAFQNMLQINEATESKDDASIKHEDH